MKPYWKENPKMMRIKEEIDLRELNKFGYSLTWDGCYSKPFGSVIIKIRIYNREIQYYYIDLKTYSAYRYKGNSKKLLQFVTQDLNRAGLIEQCD